MNTLQETQSALLARIFRIESTNEQRGENQTDLTALKQILSNSHKTSLFVTACEYFGQSPVSILEADKRADIEGIKFSESACLKGLNAGFQIKAFRQLLLVGEYLNQDNDDSAIAAIFEYFNTKAPNAHKNGISYSKFCDYISKKSNKTAATIKSTYLSALIPFYVKAQKAQVFKQGKEFYLKH